MVGHHSAARIKDKKESMEEKLTSYERELQKVLGGIEALMTKVYPEFDVPNLRPLSDQPENLKREFTSRIESLPAAASRKYVSFAGSMFLARKVLPSRPDSDPLPDYISKMGRNQQLNVEFCEFVASWLPKLFPRGWDSRYPQYCSMTSPNPSSCTERSRKKGGARGELASLFSRVEFEEACRIGAMDIPEDRVVRVLDMDGKQRIVTVASCRQWVLGPLHQLLYDHLVGKGVAMRGDATVNSFKEFVRKDGEVFVSGDYEAATDNFNRHHSEFILDVLQSTSSLPQCLWKVAVSSLSGFILVDGVKYPQIAGQMMGNLLSFPLLCLTNYLALKFAIRRHIPFRINGDDIVFRCTPEEARRWVDLVGASGLVLSKGKTLFHGTFFSLNSAFFRAHEARKPSLVPVVRAKAIFSPLDIGDEAALEARWYKASKGLSTWRKKVVRRFFLRYHRKVVRSVGCSLNRGLGIRVGYDVVKDDLPLLWQESHFLRLPASLDKPPSSGVANGVKVSDSWAKVPSSIVAEDSRSVYSYLFGVWCVNESWRVMSTVDPLKEERVRGSIQPPDLKRWARLSRTSKACLWRRLRRALLRDKDVKKWLVQRARVEKRPKEIWVPIGCRGYWLKHMNRVFVSGGLCS